MSEKKITSKYILIGIASVFFTWIIHEFAHWLTSECLGYETIMTLNSVSQLESENPTDIHKILISSAGPIITVLQGLVFFWLLKYRTWTHYGFLLLFTPFYMRLLAGIMNFVTPNDEGRIGAFLEIGIFTLPIVVSGFLFLLVFQILKKYGLRRKFIVITTLIVMLASSVLILIDQFFGIRVI